MTRRALVIAHDGLSVSAMVGRRLEAHGFRLDTFVVCPDVDRPDVADPFPAIDDYDLIVPMGSVWSVYDHPTIGTWIDEELDMLRSAHDAGTPILGICFGGQALAAALGGEVEPAPHTEIGWHVVPGAPTSPGPWFQWHHDRFAVPPGAKQLGATDAGPQAFQIGRSLGTQFHPEVDVALLEGWLSYARPDYLADHGVDPGELVRATKEAEPAARERCHVLVDWFLSEVASYGPIASAPPSTVNTVPVANRPDSDTR